MPLLVSDVITPVRVLLNDTDTGGTRYPDAELFGCLNDAVRMVCVDKPEATSKTVSHPLVAGTLQTLPADAIVFLEAVCNMAGAAARRVVRPIPRHLLDRENPDWHSAPSAAQVSRYVFSENAPRSFYVYPPNTGAGSLRIVYSALPTPVDALTDALPLPDIYVPLLLNLVCYRAHLKNQQDPDSVARAREYLEQYNMLVGKKTVSDAANDPAKTQVS